MMRLTNKSYKHLQNHRTAFYAIILTLLLNMSPAMAASSYTVENIKVDVSAGNAVEAREKAFEEAQIKGYKMLAEKFLSAEELEILKTPDINTVSVYVKDFEVSKEQLSATRYAGTYKIRYSAKAFAKKGATKKTPRKAKVRAQRAEILVLPFFEDSGYPMLWKTNPFMQAWVRARDNNNAAPSIVPTGDAQDMSAITDSQTLGYNPANLENLKQRYRASQAAVLIATPELMPDGTQNVAVGIYQAKPYGPELSRQISVRSHLGEPKDQFYNRVVREVNKIFASSWVRKTAVPQQNAGVAAKPVLTGPVQKIVAQVGFTTMRGWVDTKNSIERSHGVRGLNVKSLSPRSATVIVNYQGSVDNLRLALQQNGVDLNDPLTQAAQGGVYKISSQYR